MVLLKPLLNGRNDWALICIQDSGAEPAGDEGGDEAEARRSLVRRPTQPARAQACQQYVARGTQECGQHVLVLVRHTGLCICALRGQVNCHRF